MSAPKSITMPNNLVESFNKLPRKPTAPSGMVTNEWHFDIRYVPLEPHPSHIVAIINPGSLYFHMERLPLEAAAEDGGIAFFPESSKDAASEVAKALMYAFVNNMGLEKMMGTNAPPGYGPWKFTTGDGELAAAVGNEFKRLGVRSPELCKVGVSKPAVVRSMDAQFETLYKRLTLNAGYAGVAAAALLTPEPITFSNFKVDAPSDTPLDDHLSLKYALALANSRPGTVEEVDSRAITENSLEAAARLEEILKNKPEAVIRREADDGNPDAALDYGLRLHIGLQCQRNRTLARDYLVKAAISATASDKVRATAHGVLIGWCVEATSESIRSRYMLMASHHADQAAFFCRRASPEGAAASASVLFFMGGIFERFAPTMPQLWLLYKNAVRAFDERKKHIQGEIGKMQQKRRQQPLRYRCAAVGCGIQSDTGKMLQKCAGKCDPDKKPSYCSKECQRADWKNHKPFCVPGAECSVIDDETFNEATPAFQTGSIQMPITHTDGSRTLLSTSTLNPQMLKEIRDMAGRNDGPAAVSHAPVDPPEAVSSVTLDLDNVD